MFKKTRRNLSILYAASFLLFFLVFIVILYFSLVKLSYHQQIEELENFYEQQQEDFFKHFNDDDELISYNPNRNYFYYIYRNDNSFVHGDESYKGLYKEIERTILRNNVHFEEEEDDDEEEDDGHDDHEEQDSFVQKIQWEDEHFLILSNPMRMSDGTFGYVVVGTSITEEQHFFQKLIWLLVGLVVIFTCFIGFLSYFLAGRAMIPIQNSFEKQKKFVSDASHELRTPLSIFYSSLDILDTDESENISPFGKELIGDLKDEAQLMKDLLEKLLFLARHDQNRLEIHKEDIELSEMIENIGIKFERTLPETLTFEANVEKNIQFFGDAKSIQELMYILLENAVQYTPKGKINVSLSTVNSSIKIVVEDTGIGISSNDLPLIFDRFYRSDSARKRDGTGLGLSIAKAIVEEHGGSIQAKSELGKGTAFTILFPIIKG